MLRLYSKGCEYAIRSLIDIAVHGEAAYVTVHDLCRRNRLPEHSTRKMVQRLALKGFLRSTPGPNGGYQLARQPDRISILEVIRLVDGPGTLEGCILGLPACQDRAPCALHATWKETRRVLLPALERLTLEDISQEGQQWVERLAINQKERSKTRGGGNGTAS